MVFVQPGRDVTLYVPADTPHEVIDFLNHLKQDGMFSQGVMEILTEYVQQRDASAIARDPIATTEASHASVLTQVTAATAPKPQVNAPMPPTSQVSTTGKLNLSQIYQQAQRNADRLMDS